MGTRGFYVYRWHGRYYVYYNHWDSYPSGLGKTLLSMIPKDPEEYKKWLEQKRAEYSEIEQKFDEQVFTVVNPFEANSTSAAGVEDVEMMPSFSEPANDLWIEYIYIINLDREIFSVNGSSHFKLSSVPGDFDDLLDDAKKYNTGDLEAKEVHGSITSKTLSKADPKPEDVADYARLDAVLVQAKRPSTHTRKPLAILCWELFSELLLKYRDLIWQAMNTSHEKEYLFREVAFAFLCLATSSPALVRLARKCKPDAYTNPYGLMGRGNSSGRKREFVSALFEGYHLSDKEPGGAPATTSYWLQNVLISLERSLDCKENYQASIARAVCKGKTEGRVGFHALVCSIEYAVLIRVTTNGVEHTKRLKFVDLGRVVWHDDQGQRKVGIITQSGGRVVWKAFNEEGEGTGKDTGGDNQNEHADDESDNDWKDMDNTHTFDAIALLFESAARRTLKPSNAQTHGVFPNELYRIIVGYLDEATKTNCLTVSRAFRDFASDAFYMSDDVEVSVAQGRYKLEYFHKATGVEDLPSFSEVKEGHDEPNSLWFPVIGNADGTAQFLPSTWISLPTMSEHLEDATATENDLYDAPKRVERLDSHELDRMFKDRQRAGYRSETAGPFAGTFDYSAFEKLFPSQEIIACSSDVIGLYALVYFLDLNIFGCQNGGIVQTVYRAKPMSYIPKVPLNTWMQIGGRTNKSYKTVPYAMLWAKQPQEDSSKGWQNAMDEAQHHASQEFLDCIYKLWAFGNDTPREGVLVILIGSKIKFFHICCDVDVPSLENFPHIIADGERFKDHYDRGRFIYDDERFTLWEENGISASRLRDQISFEVFDHESSNSATSEDVSEYILALDVLNEEDRPNIESGFRYIEKLADSLGERQNDRKEP
ncbi:hypothetical protein BDV96DRAFT_584025 [Lophiotrema nucula]|uniref:F-box domain-containing protein n=1 Tax=Lophiotrema nucula TaxID=690887 RepID=A0A6A5YU18_9PLEO|nr:hypothetical protein BDV96DRAFT_584025 [Lophiotrema nucula]